MPSTLDYEPFLTQWIKDRVPALGGRVYPHMGVQDETGPYCTYLRVSGQRWGDQDGPDGASRIQIQIDVWCQVRQPAKQAADKICGTMEDKGLDGFHGNVTVAKIGTICIQRARLVPGTDFEDYEEPQQGEERGWFRISRTFDIVYNELLLGV